MLKSYQENSLRKLRHSFLRTRAVLEWHSKSKVNFSKIREIEPSEQTYLHRIFSNMG